MESPLSVSAFHCIKLGHLMAGSDAGLARQASPFLVVAVDTDVKVWRNTSMLEIQRKSARIET